MASNDIVVNVLTDVQASVKALNKLSETATTSLKSIQKDVGFTSKAFSSFIGNIAANATGKIFAEVTQGAKALFNTFITDGIEAAKGYEDAQQRLNVALQQTGIYSKTTAQEFVDLASKIQATTVVGDDAVLSTAALIQSLGSLDKDGLQKATEAAVDLSAALGIDLNSAATLVGKAAAGEVSSFSRYGIIIKKGATEAQTFANVLTSLNSKFGGAAVAQSNTYAGSLTKLGNNFQDLQKGIGFTITKNQAFITLISEVNKIIIKMSKFVEDNQAALRDMGKTIVVSLLESFKSLVEIIGKVDLAFSSLKFSLQNIFGSDEVPEGVRKINKEITELETKLNNINSIKGGGIGISAEQVSETKKRITELKAELNTIEDPRESNILKRQEMYKNFGNEFATLSEKIKKTDAETAAALKENSKGVGAAKEEQRLLDLSKAELDKANSLSTAEKEVADYIAKKEQLAMVDQDYAGRAELADKENIAARLLFEKKALDDILASDKLNKDQRLKAGQLLLEKEKQLNKLKLQAASQTFGDLSSLMQTSSQELFAVGKAAALAQAVIDGYVAIQKALSAFPPPFNFAAAAAVGVKTAVQIAGIASTNLATGITEVPKGFPNDSYNANLTSGERVVNVEQNKDLTNYLEDQQRGNKSEQTNKLLSVLISSVDNLTSMMQSSDNTIIVNVGNKEIFKEIREGLRAGRTLTA